MNTPAPSRRQWLLAASACAASGWSAPLRAEGFPSKPITLIVPYGAGGTADAIARALGERLSAQLKQQVIIDNKPGAAGVLGTSALAQSPKDGHVLALVASSPLTIWPQLQKLTYQPQRDIVPVAAVMLSPVVVAGTPALKAATLASVIALAKAKPESLTFATPGQGTIGHLILAGLSGASGAQFTHVPYKTAGQMNTDALGGVFHLFATNPSPLLSQQMKAGTLKALAVASPQRMDDFPTVATLSELGFPGAELYSTYGVVAPAGVPEAILGQLNREINRALATKEMAAAFDATEGKAMGGTAPRYAGFLRNETEQVEKIIHQGRIRLE